MARSIDNRIVSMTFDNSEFERNARTTMGTLDKLKKATDFSDASQSFRDLEKASNQLTFKTVYDGLQKIKAEFSYWEIAAIRAVQNVTDRVVDSGIRMAKALTLDQPIAGWNKYQEKTQSVQTLMNSTGKSIEEINSYLDELMWYSDQTSYGFTDMTKAMATMTSNGGKIENLVPMIEGMANATAFAGKGAAEFSRVIYNLNQSYGQGYLSMMDWKSVEQAGAASSQLKQILIDTAVELGTVKKGVMDVGNFSTQLSNKFITAEVMEKGFAKFASLTQDAFKLVQDGTYATAEEAIAALSEMSDKYDDIAIRSFRAAQEAKSFGEVIDATKDAVSSLWMAMFEQIFGNYEEGKALWSEMVMDFYDAFAAPLEGAVDFLAEWKSMWVAAVDEEGNTVGPLTQIHALYSSVAGLIREIGGYWKTVFFNVLDVQFSAKDLFDWINNLISAADGFKDTFLEWDGFQDIPSILARSIRILIDAFKTFYSSAIDPLLTKMEPIFTRVMSIINGLAGSFDILFHWMQNIGIRWFSNFLSNIVDSLSPLIDILEYFIGIVDDVVESLRRYLVMNILPTIEDDANGASDSIGLLGSVFGALKSILESVAKGFEKTKPFTDNLKNLFSNLGTWISGAWEKIKSLGEIIGDFFKNIFEHFDFSKLTKSIRAGVFTVFVASLTGLVNKIKSFDITKIFAGDKIKKGIENLTESLSPLTDALKGVTSMFGGKKNTDFVSTLKGIAVAVLELTAAFYVLSTINVENAATAIGIMMGMLAEIIGVIAILNKMSAADKSLLSGGKGGPFKNTMTVFSKVAQSILILSVALKVMDSCNPRQMGISLLVIGGLMAEMMAFIVILSKFDVDKTTKGLSGLIGVALSVVILAGALKILATISMNDLGKAFIALTGIMVELGLFTVAVSKFSGSSFKLLALGPAIIGITAGLALMTLVIKMIAKLPKEQFESAMGSLLGMLISIGVFAVAMSKLVGGFSFIEIGVGMVAFAASLALVVASLGFLTLVDSDKLMKAWEAVSLLLVSILAFSTGVSVTSGGLGFVAIAAGLVVFSLALGALTIVLMGLTLIPFGTLIESVVGIALALVALGVTAAIMSGFTGAMLSASLGLVAFGAACVVTGLGLAALSLGLGLVWDLIVTIISDIYNGIKQLVVDIGSIIGGIGDFFSWLFGGETQQQISSGSEQLANATAEGISVNQDTINEASAEAATGLVESYTEAIDENAEEAVNAADEMSDDTVEAMDKSDESEDVGINVIQGFINGLDNPAMIAQVQAVAYSIGASAISSMMAGAGVASPSKYAKEVGEFVMEGLAIGLSDTRQPELAAEQSGEKVIDILSDSIKAASEQVEDDLHPVITPILDLSDVQNGISAMNGMFGQNGEVVGMARNAVTGFNGSGRIGSIGSINLQNAFTINNGNDVNQAVLNSWADTLTNKINENLGRLL